MLSLEVCRCSSDLFLSSRSRTGLATTYIIAGYSMVEARSVNVKNTTKTHTHESDSRGAQKVQRTVLEL